MNIQMKKLTKQLNNRRVLTMIKPKNNFKGSYGFTAFDNRIFYLQEKLKPNSFALLSRLYRMTVGYGKEAEAMSNSYLQTLCNMSKNTISKSVKDLEGLNLIKTKRRSRATTVYIVNITQIGIMFDEIRANAKSCLPRYDQDSNNDETQDMTNCFPVNDQVLSHNMVATKDNLNKTLLKKTLLGRTNQVSSKSVDMQTKKSISSGFIKPTIENVRDYFIECGHPDAHKQSQRWLDHYTANGWKVGMNSMKDWKASIRNWMTNDQLNQKKGNNNNERHQSVNSRPRKETQSEYQQRMQQEFDQEFGMAVQANGDTVSYR